MAADAAAGGLRESVTEAGQERNEDENNVVLDKTPRRSVIVEVSDSGDKVKPADALKRRF